MLVPMMRGTLALYCVSTTTRTGALCVCSGPAMPCRIRGDTSTKPRYLTSKPLAPSTRMRSWRGRKGTDANLVLQKDSAIVVTIEPVSTKASQPIPSTSTSTTFAGPTICRMSWPSVEHTPGVRVPVPSVANSLTQGTACFPTGWHGTVSCSGPGHRTCSNHASVVVGDFLQVGDHFSLPDQWVVDYDVVGLAFVLAFPWRPSFDPSSAAPLSLLLHLLLLQNQLGEAGRPPGWYSLSCAWGWVALPGPSLARLTWNISKALDRWHYCQTLWRVAAFSRSEYRPTQSLLRSISSEETWFTLPRCRSWETMSSKRPAHAATLSSFFCRSA